MDDMTWTCHVCGEKRPDAMISVYSTKVDYGYGVIADVNVRYCNDKQSCRDGAPNVDFAQGKKDDS